MIITWPDNIRILDGQPYTRNMVEGGSVYGESLKKIDGAEHRFWDGRRSKLAAYIMKGGKFFPFGENSSVLYLGAASGTTVSHLSDILVSGRIFAVEISSNPLRKLIGLSEQRKNIIPIQADANQPGFYKLMVGQADILYQDIAQKNQTEIFSRNSSLLKKGGMGFLAVKARCIDVSRAPVKIFGECADELVSSGFKILENRSLEPFEKDHAMIVVKKI